MAKIAQWRQRSSWLAWRESENTGSVSRHEKRRGGMAMKKNGINNGVGSYRQNQCWRNGNNIVALNVWRNARRQRRAA
jgi:hypothetical protein